MAKRTPEQNRATYRARVARGAAKGLTPSQAAGQTKRQATTAARGGGRRTAQAVLPDGRVAVSTPKISTMGNVLGGLGDDRKVTVRVEWRDDKGGTRVSDIIGKKGGEKVETLRERWHEHGGTFAEFIADEMAEAYADWKSNTAITLVYA